jgi:hypothetical protein
MNTRYLKTAPTNQDVRAVFYKKIIVMEENKMFLTDRLKEP